MPSQFPGKGVLPYTEGLYGVTRSHRALSLGLKVLEFELLQPEILPFWFDIPGVYFLMEDQYVGHKS